MAAKEGQSAHQRINFNLRPNKRIERKLIAEVLHCIYRYDSPRRFGYIGMGSYYFSDFVLFHRLFGISRMVSIESEVEDRERFDFNRPYDCIEMVYGTTYEKLPLLQLFDDVPVICWLDYYDRLNSAILGDIDTFLSRAQLGSALIVTLKCQVPSSSQQVSEFVAALPKGWEGIADKALIGSKMTLGDFMLKLIEAKIEEKLASQNGAAEELRLCRQVVYIHYQDGAPMVTYGWLLLDADRLARLDTLPTAMDAPAVHVAGAKMAVDSPTLTFREIAHLKALLPNGVAAPEFADKAKPIPEDAAKRFAHLYRYYPSFADIEE